MKIRKIALSLAGAAALLLAGTTAASAGNPPPGPVNPPSTAFPPASVTPGQIPGVDAPGPFLGSSRDSISAATYFMVWAASSANYYEWYATSPYGILANDLYPPNTMAVKVDGGNWSLLVDPKTTACITWDGGPNQLYEVPCNSSKPSELWASSPTGNNWFFWNDYVKIHYPNDCGNTYAPVVTANSGGANLLLECPEGGPTTYTTNQEWTAYFQQP